MSGIDLDRVRIRSLRWLNIDPVLLHAQHRVFEALGLPLVQDLADGVRHGIWMNQQLAAAGADDVVFFFDIDAFPLRRAAVDTAVAAARDGRIIGLAQTANHRDPDDIYAGPMALAVSVRTWERLGRPDMRSSGQVDAGQNLTLAARREGVPVDLLYPSACLVPRWPLAGRGLFGTGTFYGQADMFHLFEGRDARYLPLFEAVAEDAAAQRPLRFGHYLELVSGRPAPVRRRSRWERWLRG